MGTAEAAEASSPGAGGSTSPLDIAHDWMIQALCTRRTDVEFFPEHGRRAAPAKVVCHACSVQLQCLDYAVANEIHDGVWGGLSPQERTPIILRRRRARATGA